MSARTAVIIGYDAISPLGIEMEDQWSRALRGKSGIGPLTRFPVDEAFPVRIAGQVDDTREFAYPFWKPRERAAWRSPIFRYAMLTVQRALDGCGIIPDADVLCRTGITYSSAVGGLDAVVNADRRWVAEKKLPHPFTNPNSCINMVGGKISMLTGATGPITATVTACATGVTSLIIGSMLLEQNRADVVLCGAVDFALVEPIVSGFSTMNGAYSPAKGEENDPPEKASRPFSRNRRGFVLAEGAGAVILAAEEFARAHGLAYGAELAGWSMTSDAHHFVAPRLETVTRCIRESIARAGIPPQRISAVNAHAASTRVGDQVEYDALQAVFDGNIPPVTANKSFLGHAMGAASAIESIFALKGMAEDRLPPTTNYLPDPEMELDCVAEGSRKVPQDYVLKNAFGFGGCNACVVFHKTQ